MLQLCAAAGIHSPLTARIRPRFSGSSEVTLAELALAYTIFPNGGWRAKRTSHILERIERKDGTLVWDGKQAERPQAGRRNLSTAISKCIPAWQTAT